MRTERAYLLNTERIESLRERSGLSLGGLAYEAGVHPTTLRRWYKGGLAFMSNVKSLADALNTSPDQIIMNEELVEKDEVVAPLPRRNRVTVTISKYDIDHFGETERAELIKTVMDAIGAMGDVVIIGVKAGSVIVTLEMDRVDYIRFLRAVAQGGLDGLGIVRVQSAETGQEIKGEIIGGRWCDTAQIPPALLDELRQRAKQKEPRDSKRKQEES